MNTIDPKTGKRYKIFQDLIDSGKAKVRKRNPLSKEAKAWLGEKMARLREWLRRGDFYKENSTQRFKED